MKTKGKLKEKQGISLIVLVITIIVIIILAVAVILAISNNNPVENAKKARLANDKAVSKEKSSMLSQQKLIKKNLENKSEEEINKEIIKDAYPDLDYDSNFDVVEGETIYTGDDENIKKELQDGLDVKSIPKDISEYVDKLPDDLIVTDRYLTGLIDKEENKLYTKEKLLAKLPSGSKITNVEGTELGSGEYVSTGCKILNKNNELMLYAVIFGENYGNTVIDIDDLSRMVKLLDNPNSLNNFQKYASDMNQDGAITKVDYDMIQKYFGLNLLEIKTQEFIDLQFHPIKLF